jgi:hypothetical protein
LTFKGSYFRLLSTDWRDPQFFRQLYEAPSLVVYEIPLSERGRVGSGQYRVDVEDEDFAIMESVICDLVRWSPELPGNLITSAEWANGFPDHYYTTFVASG